jgi:ribonuclease D
LSVTPHQWITTTSELETFCKDVSKFDFIAIDTEFIRERTYWPEISLVQIGVGEHLGIIDPLAKGLDLKPLYALLADPKVLKVFHSARQDLELFFHLSGEIPHPIFDTQVAAMVCGFGDSVGYASIVEKILDKSVNKTYQYTDWSRRPLKKEQIQYALEDVIYLQGIYKTLKSQLEDSSRQGWVKEEMAILESRQTYEVLPENAWKRIKIRKDTPKFLALLKELAAWREVEAERRNVIRSTIAKDDVLTEVAKRIPETPEDILQMRGVGALKQNRKAIQSVLDCVQKVLALPEESYPQLPKKRGLSSDQKVIMESLQLLVNFYCEKEGVARKLLATTKDLEKFVCGESEDLHFLHGWRLELFGKHAQDFMSGKLKISVADGQLKVI